MITIDFKYYANSARRIQELCNAIKVTDELENKLRPVLKRLKETLDEVETTFKDFDKKHNHEYSIKELYRLAKGAQIPYYAKLSKYQLIGILKQRKVI